MNPGYLVLHPLATSHAPPAERLIDSLRELGLVGEQDGDTGGRYRPGNAYLRLITYLGCSPSIPLADNPQEESCHLRLLGPYPAPTLISGSNSRPPRCPHCGHPFTRWQEWLQHGHDSPCHQCGARRQLERLQWREQAAVARLFLLISHVFPGEAVPVERLMHTLHREGGDWRYAYVQQPRRWCAGKGFSML
ncbi:MAG: hypothetical protein OQL28_05250 [Sedimenticola sp.]|nr:hypothetical protein [Sedimenticola sp.]